MQWHKCAANNQPSRWRQGRVGPAPAWCDKQPAVVQRGLDALVAGVIMPGVQVATALHGKGWRPDTGATQALTELSSAATNELTVRRGRAARPSPTPTGAQR